MRGFGLSTSNLVIGNITDNLRPMAGIFKPQIEPLEIGQLKMMHLAVAKINSNKCPVNIISAYLQFGHEIEPHLEHPQKILNKLKGKMTIIGVDANAHSQTWYSAVNDERGEMTLDFIRRNDLVIIN